MDRPRDQDLWELEGALWTSVRDSARTNTAAGAIVIFPYPSGIFQGDAIWAHPMADTGWRLIEMSDLSIVRRGSRAARRRDASVQRDPARDRYRRRGQPGRSCRLNAGHRPNSPSMRFREKCVSGWRRRSLRSACQPV